MILGKASRVNVHYKSQNDTTHYLLTVRRKISIDGELFDKLR